MSSATTPAVFLGHGSPMNTLEHNASTAAWAELGTSLPRLRAVVAVSAHWYTQETAVTAMAQPRTVHDFSGFPPELSEYQYPAPGSPEVAAEVVQMLAPTHVRPDLGDWGLDHGTWSVLAHVLPDADVPVVQLSIDARQPIDWHLELGQRLAALRSSGVLVLGSGNVVHNLGRLRWDRPDAGDDWAVQFDEHVLDVLTSDPCRVTEVVRHPAFRAAVPTLEHFLPVVYLAGMAVAAGTTLTPFAKGYAYGSLSMTSYRLD